MKWYISFIPGSRIRSLDHAWFNHLLGGRIFSSDPLHSIRTRSAIIIDDTRNTGAAPTSSCTVSVIILAPQSGRGGGGGGYWLPLDNAYSSASEIGDLFIEVAASLSRCRARGGGEGGRRGAERVHVSIRCPILLDLSVIDGLWSSLNGRLKDVPLENICAKSFPIWSQIIHLIRDSWWYWHSILIFYCAFTIFKMR